MTTVEKYDEDKCRKIRNSDTHAKKIERQKKCKLFDSNITAWERYLRENAFPKSTRLHQDIIRTGLLLVKVSNDQAFNRRVGELLDIASAVLTLGEGYLVKKGLKVFAEMIDQLLQALQRLLILPSALKDDEVKTLTRELKNLVEDYAKINREIKYRVDSIAENYAERKKWCCIGAGVSVPGIYKGVHR